MPVDARMERIGGATHAAEPWHSGQHWTPRTRCGARYGMAPNGGFRPGWRQVREDAPVTCARCRLALERGSDRAAQ